MTSRPRPTPLQNVARWVAVAVLGVLTTVVVLPAPPASAVTVTPFTKVFSAQTNGSIAVTGNALLTCQDTGRFSCANSLAGSGSGSTGNNSLNMVALDADSDASTSNSSRAGLVLPPGATVMYAGLYWGAPTVAGTGGTNAPGGTRTLKFKVPGSTTYETLTPDTVDNNTVVGGQDYSAFKDVTARVAAAGGGDYWGADIKAATGLDRYAGWSLIVAINDPAAPLRDLSVFNGYYIVTNTDVVDTTVSGFIAPPAGAVNAKIGMVVYEGDQQLSGDYFAVNGTRLSDAESPSGNFFQSRVTDNGVNRTDRLPASLNNLGLDAKVVDATGTIPNGATSATVRFGTNGDFYYPAALTTQVDLYAPEIVGTKTVQNLAGTTPARVGDTLEYTLTFTNVGDNEAATNAVIRDALPANVTYVPGSLRVTAGANQGLKTDAVDADQGEYLAGSRSIRVRAGPGADGTRGGTLAKNDSTTVTFRVTLDLASAGTTVRNTGQLDYRAATLGKDFTYTTGEVATPVGTLADLRLAKTASPQPVTAGNLLTYTLTATNDGPNPAVAARVVDTLPSGVTFVSASPAQGSCSAAAPQVTCQLGTVPSGGSVAITVVVRVRSDVSAAGLTNVAAVSADTSDPDTTNNSASASSTIVRSADLAITKTTSTPAPVPGTDVVYTLTATNNGPSDATSVVVNDDLPADFTSATATTTGGGTCTVSGRTVTCSYATLPAGETRTVTITARLASSSSAASIANTATISSPTSDPTPGNNSASVSITPVAPQADVRITKQTVTSPVVPGQQVEYRLTVTNAGPSDASSVTVADTPPGTVTGVGATPSQGTCTVTGGAVACALGTVAAGSSATVTVTGTVAPGTTGTLANTATVASPTDTTPGNNSATTTDTLAPRADLAIAKTATPNPVVDGNPVTFTLTVTNNGPSAAQDVAVSDPVPSPLVVTTTSSSQGSCGPVTNTVTCALGTLAAGATATVTVTASTPSGGGADGTTNVATVSTTTTDPVAGNNSASYELSAAAQANLNISKSVSPATVIAGRQVTWTLTAANPGPSDASDVTIADTVPAGVAIDSITPAGACTVTGQAVTCTRPTLAQGATFVVTIVGTVSASADAGSLSNTATVAAQTPQDPSQSDNTATATNQVDTRADVRLTKTAPATVVAGNRLTYTLEVTNGGPSDARDVVVDDELPPGTTYVGFTGAAGVDCGLQSGSDTTVECTLGTVPTGATRTITIEVAVGPGVPDATVLTNTAQASSSTIDPTPGNNDAQASTTVTTAADLAVAKVADRARIVAGLETVYTVTVTNLGPSTAINPSVVDVLPSGVTLVEATPSAGSCTEAPTGTVTCDRADLAPGAEWTISVRVFVDPSTTADQTNTVTVSSDTADPTPGNDQAEVVSPVDAAGDLELIKTAVPAPVVPGNQVTYTLTVVNYGPATMAGSTVADQLPTGLTLMSATSPDATCAGTGPGGRTVDCALGAVLPGTTVTITVVALLDATFGGATLTNAATASSTTRDTDGSNDTSSVTSDVQPGADIAVVKRSSLIQVVPGQQLDYFVEVTNLGPSTARSVEVTDVVPSGLTVLDATVVAGAACDVTGQAVTCSLGDLDPGRVLIRIRVLPDADLTVTSLTNTAAATSDTPDPVPGNNTSTVTNPVAPQADVVLTKARTSPAPPAPVVPGTRVEWTITVTNPAGPSTARGVVVTDQLAAGLSDATAVADNGTGCQIAAGLVTCPVDVVPVGGSVSVVVSALVSPSFTGSLANTASATADTTDPDLTNNDDTVTDATAAEADLQVTKTRASGPLVPGTRVSWTVSTVNTGPSTAIAATLSDQVPAALSGVTVVLAAGSPAGASCTVTANLVECDLGDLAPGTQVDVVVSGDLAADFTGSVANTAAAASDTTDSTPGNNTDTSTGNAQPAADLAIAKTRPSGPVVPGAPVTWEVTVTNLGPSLATGVTVTDDLPDDLRNVVAAGPAGVDCTTAAGNLVTCTLPDLAPGTAAVVITITADVPPAFLGNASNTATVTSATPDPAAGNNSATVDGTAAPQADVSITKSLSSGPLVPGTTVTWSLVVDNAGPSSARDITVSDDVDDALTGVSATGPAGTACTVGAGNLVSCTLPNLGPDADPVTITVTGTVPSSFTGTLANTATVASPTDVTPDNNTSTVTTTAQPRADVSITKARTSGPVVPGAPVSWVIVARNAGPSAATGVTVTDVVPAALTAITVAGPAAGSCAPVGADNTVTCSLGDLAPGQARTITVTGSLDPAFTGTLANTATVDSPTDTTPDNNSATSTGTAQPAADVSIAKRLVSGAAVPGMPVTWALDVTNAGPSVATDVTVSDDVDDALTGVTATGAGTTCDVAAGNVVSCDLPDLAPGDTVTVTITGALPAAYAGRLSNTATVASPTDDTPDNNSATVTTPAVPAADVSILKQRTSGAVVAGTTTTWAITATNNGPSVARDVIVTDDAVDALSGMTAVADDGSPCTIASGNRITCDLGNVTPGRVVVITVTAAVPPGYTATLDNTAVISSPTDDTPGNNSSTSTGDVDSVANVSIIKARTSGPVVAGLPVTWTLTVDNAGPSTATDVTVADNVLSALTGVTATGPTGTTCTVSSTNAVACDLGDVAPSDPAIVITVTGVVPPGFSGAVGNTATVASPTDADPNDNVSSVEGPVRAEADVSITKTRTSGPLVPGTDVTWQLSVTNAGPSAARGVVVTDDLADALTAVIASPSGGGDTPPTCLVRAGNRVSCDLGTLAPGDTVLITIRGSIPADFTGDLSNTALVDSPTDTTPENNTSTVPGVAVPEADVTIVKARPSGPVVPGTTTTWTLTVTNDGPSVATAVTVADDVADELTALTATTDLAPGDQCTTTAGNQVDCALGSLAPAATVVITITGDLPADFTGDLSNTAVVDSPTDTTPGNNTSTSTGTAEPVADVSVAKSRVSGSVIPGLPVSWTVTVTNNGPSVATDVTVADDVADVLTGLSATTDAGDLCTITAGNQVDCALGSLAPAATVVITITGDLPADFTGDLTNTATVDSPTDTTPANNTSTVPGTAVPTADVSITKVRDTDPIVPGEPVTWTLTVTNDGPSVATDVTVADDVADELTALTATTDLAPGDQCTTTAGNQVDCALGSLAPAATVVITITGDLPADFTGDLTNTATVDSPTDTTPANNTSTVPGTAVPTADVSITKVRDTDPIVPGEPVTWTLTVTNDGPSAATDVTVADDVADELTALTATTDLAPGDQCTITAGNQVDCALGSLAPAATVVITITGDLPADFTGDLTNTATVDSPTDTTPANNTSTVPGTAVPTADLSITKVIDGAPVPGRRVSWTLSITNDGPSVATDLVVGDVLDVALSDIQVDAPDVADCTITDAPSVTCAVARLAPGDDPVVITISALLAPDFRGDLTNTATVTSSATEVDDSDNSATVSTPVEPVADLSITKTVEPRRPIAGETVTYTLTVTNDGPSTATGVTVTDPVDTRLRDVTATAPGADTCEVGSDNVVTCAIAEIPSGGSVAILVTATVPRSSTGPITNTATVTPGPETDPDDGDLSDTVTTGPVSGADLQVTKTADDAAPVAGGTTSYSITVTNQGPAVAEDARAVDRLPSGLSAVSATTDTGSCTTSRSVVRCSLGDLAAGDVVRITVTAEIDEDVRGRLVNTVEVSSPTADPRTDNNSDGAPVVVAAPPTGTGGGTDGNGLPDTGADRWVTFATWGGLAALLAGLFLVAGSRRRRTTRG